MLDSKNKGMLLRTIVLRINLEVSQNKLSSELRVDGPTGYSSFVSECEVDFATPRSLTLIENFERP